MFKKSTHNTSKHAILVAFVLGAALLVGSLGTAMAQSGPLTASQHTRINDSGSRYMNTELTLQRSGPYAGQLDATTETVNNILATGYTGGVYVLLRNADGAVIGVTDLHTYGVDAKGCFFCRNRRTDFWQHFFPAEVAAMTASVTIIQQHTPQTRIEEIWEEITYLRDQICQTLDLCY